MAKIVKTLRNHWKKSAFACVLSYYGIDYLLERRRQFHYMRALCDQVGRHGRRPLPEGAVNKHITLFLNPAASNRKGRTKFEKFAEPILHMAGFLVTIVRTEKIDHAKELSGVINKTNIIAVAGGGGTLSEVVTGLLRREDADEAVLKYPLGIIPVGFDNEFAESLGLSRTDKEAYKIAQSAMAIVNHQIQPKDVLEIQVMTSKDEKLGDEAVNEEDTEQPKPELKPVYAMSGLRLGMFREALKRKSDMPTFLSEYWTTFWSFFRTQPEMFKAEIRYTQPCKGCLRCVKKNEKLTANSWFSYFTSFFRLQSTDGKVVIPLEDNEECGIWTSVCVETPEFNVRPGGNGSLVMEIGKKYNMTEFIKEGFNIMKNVKREISTEIEFTEAQITPIEAPEFCSIDGDEFEVKPLHIKILRNKLYFFCPS